MGGICTLGDLAKTTAPHDHNCPACPHMCQGPAISASGDVRVGGRPALRVGDAGIHAACCGPNTWVVQEGSGQVFINGAPAVRKGDKTRHCGFALGTMQTASANVADGSAAAAALGVLGAAMSPLLQFFTGMGSGGSPPMEPAGPTPRMEPSGPAPSMESSGPAPGREPSGPAPGREPSGPAPGREPSGPAPGREPSGPDPEPER